MIPDYPFSPHLRIDRNRGGHIRLTELAHDIAASPILRVDRGLDGVETRSTLWSRELDRPWPYNDWLMAEYAKEMQEGV